MSISSLSSAVLGHSRSLQVPGFNSIDSKTATAASFDGLQETGRGKASAGSRAQTMFKNTGVISDAPDEEQAPAPSKLQDKQASLAFLTQQMGSDGDVFSGTDTDGDGSVSLSELGNDDAAQGVDSNIMQRLFSMIDTDGNGGISSTERSGFLDGVRTAVADAGSRPTSSAAGAPVASPASQGTAGSGDLRSRASTAYSSTSRATDLISVLQSLLKDAA